MKVPTDFLPDVRVLIVNNYAHITGGADLHCLEITEGLRDRGHEVQWLSTQSSKNIEHAGAFIPRTVGYDNRDDVPLGSRVAIAKRAMWNQGAAAAMDYLVREFRPDVVHVHKAYVQLSVAPVVVAHRRGVPLVQTVHDYELLSASSLDSAGRSWDHDESRFSYRMLNSATLIPRRLVHRPRIGKWIAVSRSVAETYQSVAGIKCEVIPNFAAVPDRDPTAFRDRRGVLYLGRLSREKGVGHILDAAQRLPAVQFRIAGDGPLRQQVEAAEKRLANVEYMGFVSREAAGQAMNDSVACLMPSLWKEPGPLSCLEAMANGTPIIGYPSGGLAEYVSDARAGIVCPEPTPDCLVSAIREMISGGKRWEESSSGALKATRDRHSRSAYLDSLEVEYGA